MATRGEVQIVVPADELHEMLTKYFPSLKSAAYVLGQPFINDDGCLEVEAAFDTDGGDPRDWARAPMALRQHSIRRKTIQDIEQMYQRPDESK